MDKRSKMLLLVVICATVVSVGFTFYKTVVKNDFSVVDNLPVKE